jgi:nucleotide-binding universal stress UspA family protein
MKKILACTDLSDSAHEALVRAVSLAARSQASLIVLHAAPRDDGELEETRDAIRASARSEAEAIGAGEMDIHVHILAQDAKHAILRGAEHCHADLIVLGGHGQPRFRDAIFGTTGTHVVRHSAVPVLVVQTDSSLPYSTLLVAADQAEIAPHLVENALAVAPDAEVFTVHAFHASFVDVVGGDEVLDDLAAREVGALQSALTRVSAAHPGAQLGAHRHLIAAPGDALTVLRDETERLAPDLVVMGTRHRGSYLSSRAVDACFWCPADLLIVPEPAPVPADV